MLQELINLIGTDAAAKLIEIFGGTRLYIPHSPHDDDLLSASIGIDAAAKLARFYGGDRLDVPNPTPRRARIIELRKTGCSVDAIARQLGCTRRRVFQVLAEARASKRSA
ncbi:MAG: helix-turn-helix domain-containing protein [Candidatus Binataceae bacterium]|jgi:DNA-binding NarL/FixJ family response regulator